MISYSAIQDLVRKLQSTELNVRREYVQHLFLSYLYQQEESNNIFFKGGTALRIMHQSPRFSEDLDFSSRRLTTSRIEDILVQTIEEIEWEGINVDVNESKKTSGGYLAILLFDWAGKETRILLEFSQRTTHGKGEVTTIVNDFIPPYTLVHLSTNQLIAEKTQALLTRQQARDFYDLYFILRANLLPVAEKDILKKVLPVLHRTTIQFEQELKLFLPKSHWAVLRNFKPTLQSEIEKALGSAR